VSYVFITTCSKVVLPYIYAVKPFKIYEYTKCSINFEMSLKWYIIVAACSRAGSPNTAARRRRNSSNGRLGATIQSSAQLHAQVQHVHQALGAAIWRTQHAMPSFLQPPNALHAALSGNIAKPVASRPTPHHATAFDSHLQSFLASCRHPYLTGKYWLVF
jgi:hypothetical protein